jgi:acetoacetyl-CoA reductase
VIANFCGDQARADLFHTDTGIPVRRWDVSDFEATQSAMADVAREFGLIEILVNNAGITRDSTLHKMTLQQWREVIDVNLGGCFNMCRAVIESMRQRNFGRIVNVSSVNAQSGQFGQCNYVASKAGLIGFTKSLALESMAHGISVNVITPGYTDTAMVRAVPAKAMEGILANVPAGRLAKPEEIARGILFLVDDQAGYITGATLPINGGKYLA